MANKDRTGGKGGRHACDLNTILKDQQRLFDLFPLTSHDSIDRRRLAFAKRYTTRIKAHECDSCGASFSAAIAGESLFVIYKRPNGLPWRIAAQWHDGGTRFRLHLTSSNHGSWCLSSLILLCIAGYLGSYTVYLNDLTTTGAVGPGLSSYKGHIMRSFPSEVTSPSLTKVQSDISSFKKGGKSFSETHSTGQEPGSLKGPKAKPFQGCGARSEGSGFASQTFSHLNQLALVIYIRHDPYGYVPHTAAWVLWDLRRCTHQLIKLLARFKLGLKTQQGACNCDKLSIYFGVHDPGTSYICHVLFVVYKLLGLVSSYVQKAPNTPTITLSLSGVDAILWPVEQNLAGTILTIDV
ncbi:hypothetical protein VNO77_22919 [Canavalia gladiata]|uniref:Uncharacterized protein n=1 Tax=Canavalia gladiata TaxID=3824 RepID=A0AAN9L3N4_CANGL